MYDIIVDIDGTIADNEWRSHHLRQKDKNWVAYKAGVMEDEPIQDILFILRAMLRSGCRAVLCTGRGEEERADTEAWLAKHGLYWFQGLYMRPAADHRPDYIIKTELLAKIREDGFDPQIVFEDRNSVVEMWRSLGLRCLQVKPGDF